MNFRAIFIATIAALGAVHADPTVIPHGDVHPFSQPVPTTDAQKAAVKYRPMIKIEEGCHPYAVVQSDGSISGGLNWSGPQDGECTGSPLGSQIYSRSAWVKDKWAILYCWYFPKGETTLGFGHRHAFECVVVWLDKPSADNATILGTSITARDGWAKEVPPQQQYFYGNALKVQYYYNALSGKTALKYTENAGEVEYQIQWDQLSDAARVTLNNTDWNVKVPFKDGVFMETLEKAYPF